MTTYINELISHAIYKSLLLEDRIPSLRTQFMRERKIKSYRTGREIVQGVEPTITTIPMLHPSHDRSTTLHLEENPHLDPSKHIFDQIVDADPSVGNEYTEQMLRWYSKSATPTVEPTSTRFSRSLPMSDDDDKAQLIDREHEEKYHEEQRDEYSLARSPFVLEDLGRATEALQVFHKSKNSPQMSIKNISQVKSLKHLEAITEPFRMNLSPEKDFERLKEIDENPKTSRHLPTILNNGRMIVRHLANENGSLLSRRGTNWCVGNPSLNRYSQYNGHSPIVMFHDVHGLWNQHMIAQGNDNYFKNGTKHNNRKYLMSFEPLYPAERKMDNVQFMDEQDSPIDPLEFAKIFPEINEIPHLQHLHKQAFQSPTRPKTSIDSIGDHEKIYPQFHREGDKEELLSSTIPREIGGDYDQVHQLNHPTTRHYFGSETEPPKATPEETMSFVKHYPHSSMHPLAIKNLFTNGTIQKLITSRSPSPTLTRGKLNKLAHQANNLVDHDVFNILTDPSIVIPKGADEDGNLSFVSLIKDPELLEKVKKYITTSPNSDISLKMKTPLEQNPFKMESID